MNTLLYVLSMISLLLGSLFILVAGIGILRLPDLLCRSHAVAKAMTLGICLMFLGLYLDLSGSGTSTGLKIILAVVFQLLTIPVSSHLLCQLAMDLDLPRWRGQPLEEIHAERTQRADPEQIDD